MTIRRTRKGFCYGVVKDGTVTVIVLIPLKVADERKGAA